MYNRISDKNTSKTVSFFPTLTCIAYIGKHHSPPTPPGKNVLGDNIFVKERA